MPSWLTPQIVTDAWPGFASLPDAEQQRLVDGSMQAVEDYCRRSFERQMVTDVLDGRNSPRLYLSTRPVVTVASVTVNGDPIDNSTGTGWAFKAKTGELIRGGSLGDPRFGAWFPRGTGNVVVVYWAGYDPVPAPVVRAGIITTRWYAEASKNAGIYSEERIGDYSYKLADTGKFIVPPNAGSLLANYVQDDLA